MSKPQLRAVDNEQPHARDIARQAVAKYQYRRGSAIDSRYNFSNAPIELRQTIYNMIVRFSRRRLWSRLLR